MSVADIQARSENWNMKVIGHHDLNGHGDGMQLLKQGRYVYLAHLGTSPMALSIIDVADPSDPRVVKQIPHEPNTHSHKVQIAGDILIQQGTNHAWVNRGAEPCRIAFVLIDAKEP